ncbi:MAG: hypothetical protein LBT91_01765 [Bifidobacteriaceae bacterium]|jgi:hypothetical protein|nr:hypothetical protein [Bifidobacteriaceae bacterium]
MKFLKLKKLGILAIIFLFGICTFISGRISVAKADGSISTLPISRGGTGANSASGALDNLGKVNSVDSNSTDEQFPSAKGVYNWGSPTIGIDNFYMKTTSTVQTPPYVYLLGELPTEAMSSKISTLFVGQFLAYRYGVDAIPGIFEAKIIAISSYRASSFYANALPSANYTGGMPRMPRWEIGKFTYDSKSYVGLAMVGGDNGIFWNITSLVLKGFYDGTLAAKCQTENDLCVGKKILLSSVSDYQMAWQATE